MPKLHFKRTPAEQAEYEARKSAKKAARKAKKLHRRSAGADHSCHSDHDESCDCRLARSQSPPMRKRRRHESGDSNVIWGLSGDENDDHLPPPGGEDSFTLPSGPSERQHKPDYDAIRADLEEKRFREKILGALEDDEGLHFVEARLNDYAHVPGRWRGGRGAGKGRWGAEDGADVDPRDMSDEEYAEWIRVGMWRRTHAAEYAAQMREQALKDARHIRERELQAEASKLEKAAEEERKRKRSERERNRWDEAREGYDRKWKVLLSGETNGDDLRFADVPWPLVNMHTRVHKNKERRTTTMEDLTEENISAFLLSRSPGSGEQERGETEKKERKERLRETMLRFHPDKFEGRLMGRVREEERANVREGVGQVVRVLNNLMATA